MLGEYVDIFGGNAYYAFSEDNIERQTYDPSLPLCWALDFNVDRMCSAICQLKEWKRTAWATAPYEYQRTVRVLDEIVLLRDSHTVEAAEEFVERVSHLKNTPERIQVRIYGDASGNGRSSNSTKTDYELVREVSEDTHVSKLRCWRTKPTRSFVIESIPLTMLCATPQPSEMC